MATPHLSLFRDALQVSEHLIAALDDIALNTLMRDLLAAQAYRCGAPVNQIRVNTESRAPDDGCDGWSPKPTDPNLWLGSMNTCWQFKAGVNGQPAKLSGEVEKPIPKETLLAGGRFIVVASGSTSGKKGEDERLEVLRNEAKLNQLPVDNIDVIGSERLPLGATNIRP